MSGLLDLMGGSYGEDDPRRAAAMALFAGLLGGKGNLGGIVSDSITGAQKSFLLNREAQQRSQENQSKLEEQRRKVADEEARRVRIQQAITAFPQAKPVAGPPTEDGVQPMRNPTRNDILPWALGVMPDSRELANLGFGQIERLDNREDAQTAKRESQAAQLKAMLEKAAADRDAAGERKRLEIQGREDLARLGASLRPAKEAPDAGIEISDSAVENAAARYNTDGTLPPNLGRGMQGSKLTAKILDRAALIAAEDGDDSKAQRIRQIANKGTAGAILQLSKQEASVGAFERNFTRNADIALELSKTTDKTGIPIANKWINVGKRAVTGDPELSAYDAALKTVVNEYTKILSGAMGNTQMAEGEVKKVEALLNAAQTPEQVESVIALMKRETQNRMIGFKEQQAEMRKNMIPDKKPQDSGEKNLPPIDKLTEGQVTTFGNGQKWTLRGGKPVKVN